MKPKEDTHYKQKQAWRGLAAALLSMMVPGMGQLRNGRIAKAILFYSLSMPLAVVLLLTGAADTFTGFVAIAVWLLGWTTWAVFDALMEAYYGRTGPAAWYTRAYFLIPLLCVVFIITFAVRHVVKTRLYNSYYIPSASMEPTLQTGDYIIADLRCYHIHTPASGDIVIFRHPNHPVEYHIKRCIGVAGQEVAIRDKVVYVDGNLFSDSIKVQFTRPMILPETYQSPYIYPEGAGNWDNYGPVLVPEDHIFVLGDNRDDSMDSRIWGFVPLKSVRARPLYIYWSADKRRISMPVE